MYTILVLNTPVCTNGYSLKGQVIVTHLLLSYHMPIVTSKWHNSEFWGNQLLPLWSTWWKVLMSLLCNVTHIAIIQSLSPHCNDQTMTQHFMAEELSLGGQRLSFEKCANLSPVSKGPSVEEEALEGTSLFFRTLHDELSKRQTYKQTPTTHNKQPATSHMSNIWQICHYLSLCVCCHTTIIFPHSQQPLHST